jgi:hypothetical protein
VEGLWRPLYVEWRNYAINYVKRPIVVVEWIFPQLIPTLYPDFEQQPGYRVGVSFGESPVTSTLGPGCLLEFSWIWKQCSRKWILLVAIFCQREGNCAAIAKIDGNRLLVTEKFQKKTDSFYNHSSSIRSPYKSKILLLLSKLSVLFTALIYYKNGFRRISSIVHWNFRALKNAPSSHEMICSSMRREITNLQIF